MGTPLQHPPAGHSCSRRGFLPFHHHRSTHTPVPGHILTPSCPLFLPTAGGKEEDRTPQLRAVHGCSHHPFLIHPKMISHLSVTPPWCPHPTGETRVWLCCREIPGTGPTPGLLSWLCSCTPARLPRLGTHVRLRTQHCRTCHKLSHAVPCSTKPKEKLPNFPTRLPGRGACSTGRLGTRISQMSAHPVPSRPALDTDLARLSCAHTSPAAGPGANIFAGGEEDARGNGELRLLASHDNLQWRFIRRDLFPLPAAVCGRSRLAARPGHLSGHTSAGRAGAQPSTVWCTHQRWDITASPTWPSPQHWAGLFPSAHFPGLSWSLNKPRGGGSSLPSPELALIVLFNTAPAPQACFNPHYHGQKVICRSTPLLLADSKPQAPEIRATALAACRIPALHPEPKALPVLPLQACFAASRDQRSLQHLQSPL